MQGTYVIHTHTIMCIHVNVRARSQLVAVSPHTGCTNVGMEQTNKKVVFTDMHKNNLFTRGRGGGSTH